VNDDRSGGQAEDEDEPGDERRELAGMARHDGIISAAIDR
jgi:hypothetical protein